MRPRQMLGLAAPGADLIRVPEFLSKGYRYGAMQMNQHITKTQLRVRTQVRGGSLPAWGKKCLNDHDCNMKTCCIGSDDCKDCIDGCYKSIMQIHAKKGKNYMPPSLGEMRTCADEKNCLPL